MKNSFSPSFGITAARRTISSSTANLNFSAVLGALKVNGVSTLFMARAALTASLSAKNTVDPKNNGGSPVPLLL